MPPSTIRCHVTTARDVVQKLRVVLSQTGSRGVLLSQAESRAGCCSAVTAGVQGQPASGGTITPLTQIGRCSNVPPISRDISCQGPVPVPSGMVKAILTGRSTAR